MINLITHVWFDLDNTLVDRNAAMESCMHDWLKEHSALSDAEIPLVVQEAMLFDNWGYTTRTDFALWLQARTKARLDMEPLLVARSIMKSVTQHIRAYSGTEEVLIACRRKYSIGMLTNGPSELQRAKIECSGMDDYFAPASILVSGELGVDKPDAQAFQHLLNAASCDPHQLLYVGDDPVKDVLGASKLDIPSCWISHGRSFPENLPAPTYVISDITKLADLLKL